MDEYLLKLQQIVISDYNKLKKLKDIILLNTVHKIQISQSVVGQNPLNHLSDEQVIIEMGQFNIHNKKITVGQTPIINKGRTIGYNNIHEHSVYSNYDKYREYFVPYIQSKFEKIDYNDIIDFFDRKVTNKIGLINLGGICWQNTYFHSILPEILIEHIDDVRNVDLTKIDDNDIRNINIIYFLYCIYDIYKNDTNQQPSETDNGDTILHQFQNNDQFIQLLELKTKQDKTKDDEQQILSLITLLTEGLTLEEKIQFQQALINLNKKYYGGGYDDDDDLQKAIEQSLIEFANTPVTYEGNNKKYLDLVNNFNLLKMYDSDKLSNLSTSDYNDTFMNFNIYGKFKDGYSSDLYIQYKTINYGNHIQPKTKINVNKYSINIYDIAMQQEDETYNVNFLNNPTIKIKIMKYIYIPTESNSYTSLEKNNIREILEHDNYVNYENEQVTLKLFSIILHPNHSHYKCLRNVNNIYYMFNDRFVTNYGTFQQMISKLENTDYIYGLWYIII